MASGQLHECTFGRGIETVQEELEANKNGAAEFKFDDITTFKVIVANADPDAENKADGAETIVETGKAQEQYREQVYVSWYHETRLTAKTCSARLANTGVRAPSIPIAGGDCETRLTDRAPNVAAGEGGIPAREVTIPLVSVRMGA